MHFSCQCLNITVDVLQLVDDPVVLNEILPQDFSQLLNTSIEWNLCHVSLKQPIHIVWQSLSQTMNIREMKLTRCLACQQYTHLIDEQSNRLLLNKDLLDEKSMRIAQTDVNYSQMAKIVLPNSNFVRFNNGQDEICQQEQESIQQLFRQALEEVEQETEEKIRIYQREQEQLLEKKTTTLNQELNQFLNVIRSAPRYSSNVKISPTLHTSSSYFNENSMESGFGSDIFDNNVNEWSRQSSTAERNPSERTSDPDEETSSYFAENQPEWSINASAFATSLPQEIAFRPMPLSNNRTQDGDDLERIGKSFRELSQSLMCTDGTELFGDLPSPRLNLRAT